MPKKVMSATQYQQMIQHQHRHKYKARQTEVNGIKFPSAKEGNYYAHLLLRQKAGDIAYFHRQVPFDLPGPVRYFCDFLVVYPDRRLEYIDVKGFETPLFKLKKKQVEDIYGIEIILA